jgi:CRP-like cAMP-binding protein
MAAQSDHLAFLRSTPLFASVPEDTLARIAEIASEKSHGTGKVIVRQGGQAHAFHLIVEGEVEVVADGVVVATLGPRDHFGEIAVVKNAKRNATVTAISPARVLAIDTISFRRLVDSDAALADALPPAIAERLAERDEKLAD